MVGRVKEIFNVVSDGVVRERKMREAEEVKLGIRITRVEDEVKVVKERSVENGKATLEGKIRRSEAEMARKVKAACCTLKLQDIEFRGVMEDKREIVRDTIAILKGDVHPEDRYRFDRVLKRTRVVVLGRRTESRRERGRHIYTVPILLELGSSQEAEEMGEILRRVGYFTSFHWPSEIMPFINDIRGEMRESGYDEDRYHLRARPEVRGGEVQIRTDVKHKDGGRWVTKAFWFCPPLDRELWRLVDGLYEPKIVNSRG
jgi:hypothetical protein